MAGNTAILTVKILADARQAAKGMEDVGGKASKMQAGIKSAAVPAAAALALVGAAAIDAGKAAAEDAESQAILAKQMENSTGANKKQIAAMEDYISKTSEATAVADDELRPALGNLLRATNDTKKSQEGLTAALDLSAATGKSVETTSKAIAKAYGGSTDSLSRLVPGMDKAVLASGDMSAIMDEVADKTGGAAAAAADTAAGKMRGMQIAMDEAKETAGTALLPIMAKFADVLAKVAQWVGQNIGLVQGLAVAIGVIAGAILLANAAIAIYNTVTTIAGIVSGIAWAAALGPILLVIAAVALVIGAVVLLWNKSETFKTVVTAVWDAIKKAIGFVVDAISDVIDWIAKIKVPGLIKTAFENIKEAVSNVWDWIVKLIGKIADILVPGGPKAAFGFIRDAVETVWDWVVKLINKIGDIGVPESIKNAFVNIKEAVGNAWDKVGDLIQKIKDINVPDSIKNAFNAIKEAVGDAWSKVGDLISKIGDISIPGAIVTAVNAVKTAIDNVTGAVGTLISKISNISFPSPPKWFSKVIPGGNMMAPAPSLRGARFGGPTATAAAGPTVNITVTGAIDPEATARQIQRIMRGHDRRVGSGVMIGLHKVLVYQDPEAPTGTATDVTCLIDDLDINHGRGDTSSQPEPSSCTLNITAGPGTPMPDPSVVDIGAWIVVSTEVAGVEYTRFVGRVTDVSIGWDDAGPDTPEAGVGQVVAISTLADYARRIVGDEPFPQELDGARVARVFELAGVTLDPAFSDPGTVQVIPRDVDARAALEVASDTAVSAGGLIWATRDGEIRYADAEHRRGTSVALELDACDILVSPTWMRNISGLVNEVSMTYGVAPEGGEAPNHRASNADSVARFGRFEYSVTVELAALADVTAAVNLILVQNGSPVWLLQALPVDVFGLSTAETQALLSLELHSLLRVSGLPATGPTPTSIVCWVEGWVEHLAWGVHEVELIVSDYCRTSPPPRWNDVDPATTWDTAPGTWDGAACMGPPADLGRWDDVPATVRWDQVDPGVSWDEAGV